MTRRPRRLVPMRRDELLGVLAETDRMQLADDTVLLVRDDGALPQKVLAVLSAYGHFGTVYAAETSDERLPWLACRRAGSSSMTCSLRRATGPETSRPSSPGPHRNRSAEPGRWAQDAGACAQVVEPAPAGDPRSSRRSRKDHDHIDRTRRGANRTRAVERVPRPSPFPSRGWNWRTGTTRSSRRQRRTGLGDHATSALRGRTGLVSWEQAPRLNYDLRRSALAVVSAEEHEDDDSPLLVDGPNTLGAATNRPPTVAIKEGISWSKTSSSAPQQLQTIVLGNPDPTSCLVTGKHRIELPTFHGGKSRGVIEGVCGTCGIRKVYPARPKWKKSQWAPHLAAQALILDLPTHSGATIGWDACLDALIHVGGGSLGALERVATQREGSSLFVDSFLRTLEGLGHLDVRRDESLQPEGWEANPAYLAETPARGFALLGVWSSRSRRALGKALDTAGGSLECEGDPETVSTWFARGISTDALTALVVQAGLEAYVVPDAVRRMLAVLPPLSALDAALPQIAVPTYNKAAVFHVPDAAWRVTPGVGVPGAYRLEQSFRTRTIWVDTAGAVSRHARVGSVQLVKHLAARAAGRPLIGWLPRTEMLVVPLGADLPGLYGRAAMLCSGRPPQPSRASRALGYAHVPRWAADALTTLLAS